MPYIEFKTNVELTENIKNDLSKELGRDIKLLHKSEDWLMLNFVDKQSMFFKGQSTPCIIAEVKLYGQLNESDAEKFTNSITNIINKYTNIPVNRIYINYFTTDNWGYSGFNF